MRLLTSYDARQSCGLATVAVAGVDPARLASHLFSRHRIIATPIKHEEFEGLRVTPNVYTTRREIDAFGEAMEQVIEKGLPG